MKVMNTSYQNSIIKSFRDRKLTKFVPIFASTSLLFGLLSTPIVFAQEQVMVLEEIVVTARKRVELIQDVPIAITAFDADAIERAHISTTADLEKFVPNVDFSDNPFAGQALGATIRGVGFSDFEKSFEPAVGFSIDGVFLASNTGAAIDAFDIERIEVLRGPQGTLYGRNTVGGVINVTRTRPTGETGLKLGTRFTNNGGTEVLLVANTPKLGDSLSTKFYMFDKEDETFGENIITGEADDQTDVVSYGAAFLYQPNDKLEALVSVDFFDDDSQGPPTYNLSQPGELFCDLPNTLASFGVFTADSFNAGCSSRSFDIAQASDFELYTREVPFITHLEGSSVTSNIQYAISDTLTLTSITGYRETDEQLLEEPLGAPNLGVQVAPGVVIGFPVSYTNRVQEASQFSQELRLSGERGDRLTFVTGLFYMQSDYQLSGGEFPDGSFGTAQSFGSVVTDELVNQDTTAWALFVDGTYELTDRLSLSGGLRYSREEKELQKSFFVSSAPGVSGTSAAGSESWSNPTGRVILQYDISDDVMVYGGFSRGFRSGGFNGRAGTPTAIGPYDEETVNSIELGFRAEFFDNRLRFNPTFFSADYDDKQEENAVATPGGMAGAVETTVQNASAVDIKGMELEILALISPSLTFRGAFGLLDAEFSEFLVPANPFDPSNTSVIDVSDSRNLRAGPDATASIGLTYFRSLMQGNAQLTFNAAYNWADELVTSAATDVFGLGRDTVDVVEGADFALSFETLHEEGANFTVSAYVNDAFDDGPGRNAVGVVVPGIFAFGAGAPTKTYGLELSVDF